ncbi:hypothetical protein Hanom_Chr16g01438881 [Helianthus anomalus]
MHKATLIFYTWDKLYLMLSVLHNLLYIRGPVLCRFKINRHTTIPLLGIPYWV